MGLNRSAKARNEVHHRPSIGAAPIPHGMPILLFLLYRLLTNITFCCCWLFGMCVMLIQIAADKPMDLVHLIVNARSPSPKKKPPLLSQRRKSSKKESSKRTISASGKLGLLQIVLEPDIGQCAGEASEEAEP